ncbi:hypothetical protein AB2N04_14635 [Nitratireductor sp. GISD-1A_MAKvit]|uniref:hypothetical protein n=1 Tax=Nitratireductor sp. GISD-1A_MAKvit TaxID=3234198 RepID=UPI00346719D5
MSNPQPIKVIEETIPLLRKMSEVMQGEHNWFLEELAARRAENREEFENGWKSEADLQAVTLTFLSEQADKHLDNIWVAAAIAETLADYLQNTVRLTKAGAA